MMKSEPLVSVLMTAFNREKYIGDAIESVLASSYQNFELLIVDDCSSDKTVEIAKQYVSMDPRVKLFVNETNLGDYHNRNRAAKYASGKYIKYLDSDDLIYQHGLAVMVSAMEQFPDAALGISTAPGQDLQPYPYSLPPREAYLKNFYGPGIFNTGPSGLIIKTTCFFEVDGFSGTRYIGDTEINLRLAARWPVVLTGPSLVFWRIHAGQEFSAGLTGTGYLEVSLPMLEKELSRDNCPLSAAEVKQVLTHYKKIYSRQLINLAIKQKQPGKALSLSKQLSIQPADMVRAVLFMNQRLQSKS